MNHERRAVGPDARRDIRAPQFYPETVEPSEDDALQRRTMDQLGLSYATMFHSQVSRFQRQRRASPLTPAFVRSEGRSLCVA